jgi:hypothetical protein
MTTNLTTATNGLAFGNATNQQLAFLTNNTGRMFITGASGYVGVGLTNPTEKLQVSNGNVRANQLIYDSASNTGYIFNIGNVVNNGTHTLPSGRWVGELFFSYGNDSGRAGMKRYSWYKAPGATGNGISGTTFVDLNSGGTDDSSATFNTNTGVFTFSLGGVNPSAVASIQYRSAT